MNKKINSKIYSKYLACDKNLFLSQATYNSILSLPRCLCGQAFKKVLSRIFLILQSFLLSACLYTVNGCSSGEVKKTVSPGLEAEYLVLNEKVLLHFYGSPDERDWATKTLERRCDDKEDPHACYNLASQFFSLKNFAMASKYAEKAVLQSPKDSLYLEMYRQSLIENNKLEIVNNSIFPQADNTYLLTKLEVECRNKKTDSAFSLASELVSKKILSQESVRNGFLPECLNDKMISDLVTKAQSNKINFTNHYYAEKNKSNLFSSIWDTSYLTKNKPIEKEEEITHKITGHWRDLRKAVAAKNKKQVQKAYNNFTRELKQEKANSKKDANLYTALERAAELLIEQDEFFSGYRNLLKEN